MGTSIVVAVAVAAVSVVVIVCVRHGWACGQRTRANWLAGIAIQSRE